MTKDEQEKIASEIQKAKYRGFISHLHAEGTKEADVKELFGKYKPQDQKRIERIEGLKAAILGEDS